MRDVQFLVHEVHRDVDGIFVGGRNCKDQIVLGDVLNILFHGSSACEAEVRGILTYRQRMNILDVGMTGEIEILTQDPDEIAVGCELVGSFRNAAPEPLILGMGEFHVKPA